MPLSSAAGSCSRVRRTGLRLGGRNDASGTTAGRWWPPTGWPGSDGNSGAFYFEVIAGLTRNPAISALRRRVCDHQRAGRIAARGPQ